MMNTRILILTICATAAACAAGTSLSLAQGYPASPGSYTNAPAPYPPPEYRRRGLDAMPDFDEVDDDDSPRPQNSTALPPPGPVMSPDDPRYGRPIGAPVYSDRTVPQGPVLSPDDPRYGRPMASPPVIYADRPGGPAYSDRGAPGSGFIYPDDNGRDRRPPEAVGSEGPATSSVQSPAPLGADGKPMVMSALPADDQPEAGPAELPPNLRRQEVALATKEPPGTLIVDTPNTYLYYVLGGGRAIRYGVRVGRDGFTWTGTQKITRKAEWPDWHPPSEMIDRQPYLPRFMAGGPGNPLGARAMYLGSTVYRIHGTNQPSTIGKFVSSGCIGMLNEDVSDLFDRVKVGTRVVVLPGGPVPTATASAQPIPGPNAGSPLAQVSSVPGTQPTSVPPLPAPVTIR
jgi:lipoprotein-anchoring transpeptidase ErfK/SrfK